jgi:hypothetical protein
MFTLHSYNGFQHHITSILASHGGHMAPASSSSPRSGQDKQNGESQSRHAHDPTARDVRGIGLCYDWTAQPLSGQARSAGLPRDDSPITKPANTIVDIPLVTPLQRPSALPVEDKYLKTAPQLVSIRAAQGPSSPHISDALHKGPALAHSGGFSSVPNVQAHERSPSGNYPRPIHGSPEEFQSQSTRATEPARWVPPGHDSTVAQGQVSTTKAAHSFARANAPQNVVQKQDEPPSQSIPDKLNAEGSAPKQPTARREGSTPADPNFGPSALATLATGAGYTQQSDPSQPPAVPSTQSQRPANRATSVDQATVPTSNGIRQVHRSSSKDKTTTSRASMTVMTHHEPAAAVRGSSHAPGSQPSRPSHISSLGPRPLSQNSPISSQQPANANATHHPSHSQRDAIPTSVPHQEVPSYAAVRAAKTAHASIGKTATHQPSPKVRYSSGSPASKLSPVTPYPQARSSPRAPPETPPLSTKIPPEMETKHSRSASATSIPHSIPMIPQMYVPPQVFIAMTPERVHVEEFRNDLPPQVAPGITSSNVNAVPHFWQPTKSVQPVASTTPAPGKELRTVTSSESRPAQEPHDRGAAEGRLDTDRARRRNENVHNHDRIPGLDLPDQPSKRVSPAVEPRPLNTAPPAPHPTVMSGHTKDVRGQHHVQPPPSGTSLVPSEARQKHRPPESQVPGPASWTTSVPPKAHDQGLDEVWSTVPGAAQVRVTEANRAAADTLRRPVADVTRFPLVEESQGSPASELRMRGIVPPVPQQANGYPHGAASTETRTSRPPFVSTANVPSYHVPDQKDTSSLPQHQNLTPIASGTPSLHAQSQCYHGMDRSSKAALDSKQMSHVKENRDNQSSQGWCTMPRHLSHSCQMLCSSNWLPCIAASGRDKIILIAPSYVSTISRARFRPRSVFPCRPELSLSRGCAPDTSKYRSSLSYVPTMTTSA